MSAIRSYLRLAILPAALLTCSACGLDELGVLSIHVELAPVPVAELPAGLESLEVASLALAAGEVAVDVPSGFGTIDVTGLPDLPDGFSYVPLLGWQEGARHGLPEVAGAHDDGGGGHAEEEPEMGPVDALQSLGDLEWSTVFTAADAGDVELGALRSTMIMLVPEGAMPMGDQAVMVLHGEVDFTNEEGGAAPEEEAGHSHGV